jgi:type I restriction enzyme S subunit
LRFPEFHEEWEEFKLKDIAKMYDGTHQTPKYVQQGIPFYSVENVTANNFSKTKYIAKDIFEKENKRVKIEQGDILMTRIGDIGTAKYIDWNVQASFYVSLALIKPNKSYSGQYIAHYISTNKFQSELWNRTIHVAFPKKINLGEIGECLINIPCSSEQNQIAACLSLIDERIECQKKIIQKLESLSLSFMRKIFSQEIRFKDENGEYFPDWKIQKLGEIATITTGSSNREDSILDGQYTFFDRSQDIRTSNRYLFDKEAIIVPGEGQTFIPKYYHGKFDLHQRTYAIFDFQELNGKYLYYHIFYDDKHLQSQAVGSTVKSLRLPMFQTMPIALPSLLEQTKIAKFLSSLDEKIEAEKQLLEQYKQQKAYLLQNLFI